MPERKKQKKNRKKVNSSSSNFVLVKKEKKICRTSCILWSKQLRNYQKLLQLLQLWKNARKKTFKKQEKAYKAKTLALEKSKKFTICINVMILSCLLLLPSPTQTAAAAALLATPSQPYLFWLKAPLLMIATPTCTCHPGAPAVGVQELSAHSIKILTSHQSFRILQNRKRKTI